MRVVAALLCVLGAGCDALFGLDHLDPTRDAATDAADQPVDASSEQCAFQPRILLQSGSGSHDPTLSADRMELFIARDLGAGYDLYRAVRTDVSQPFGAGLIVAELSSSADDTDPSLTEDGMMIVFKSDRGGNGPRAYQATRSAANPAFTSPQVVPGLENTPVFGLDISPDGLTLYFDDGAKLTSVHRMTRGDAFGMLSQLTLDRTGFPSVSADGLEVYYNGGGLIRRTRANTSTMFDAASEELIDAGGADGDLLPDGSALVLTGGAASDVVYLRERCP